MIQSILNSKFYLVIGVLLVFFGLDWTIFGVQVRFKTILESEFVVVVWVGGGFSQLLLSGCCCWAVTKNKVNVFSNQNLST